MYDHYLDVTDFVCDQISLSRYSLLRGQNVIFITSEKYVVDVDVADMV